MINFALGVLAGGAAVWFYKSYISAWLSKAKTAIQTTNKE